MDGFAVRLGTPPSARVFRLLPGLVVPGGPRGRVATGAAVRISTGAAVPVGADAVVRQERARVVAGELRVSRPVARGTDIHRRAEDLPQGSLLLRSGERIRPYHLALLAAQGVETVRVRSPRITILVTGEEFLHRTRSGSSSGRDTISPLVGRLVPEAGAVRRWTAGDDRGTLARFLRRAAKNADLVVTIGGTSVGLRDQTKAAVRSVGRAVFEGVRVNVLKRGAVGVVDGVPIVMLPGQIVSAVIAWHEYGRPLMDRLTGAPARRPERVALARAVRNPHPMDSVYLFRVLRGVARPCRWGVRLYSELARANAYGIVPRHSVLPAGASLEVRWLDPAP